MFLPPGFFNRFVNRLQSDLCQSQAVLILAPDLGIFVCVRSFGDERVVFVTDLFNLMLLFEEVLDDFIDFLRRHLPQVFVFFHQIVSLIVQEVQFFLEHLHSDVEELEASVVVLSFQFFLRGRLLTEDGASLPFCVEEEVICFPSQFACLLHFILALINSYIQIRL